MKLQPLTRPRRLTQGDRVVVVAPSGPVPKDRLDAGCEILRGWGLDVVVAPHATDRHERFDYLAGADADRAADLQAAWCDPSVAAVICARGGYGAQRMVDLLDWSAMAQAEPKVFIGFSDITALHEAFANCLGVATLHAPMAAVDAFIGDAGTAEHLRQTLFEPESVQTLTSEHAHVVSLGGPNGGESTVSGVTLGGCISLLAADLATPTGRPNVSGGILMIEEVGEEAYRIDRYITHMLRTGWLDGVAAVVLGSSRDCDPIEELLADRFGHFEVPIISRFGFGHGEQTLTIPFGVAATLDAKTATLSFDTPALA
jgi:muramoyltetrapeptide carboxypeptidase